MNTTIINASRTPLRFDVCIDTLMNGCVSSFVDLFTLSHRDPVCVDELSQIVFSVPNDSLEWLQERLVCSELKGRRRDFKGMFAENLELAEYFERNKDIAQAVRYYDCAMQAAVQSLDTNFEAKAHDKYGAFCERIGDKEGATSHYDTCLKLVEMSGDMVSKVKACRPLITMHLRRGKEEQEEGNLNEAKVHYEKAVSISRSCNDYISEAKAYSALGDITVLLGDMSKALGYQKRFLMVSRQSNDTQQQSQASLQVAKLQHQLGHKSEAIDSLKEALKFAEDNNLKKDICEVCRQLGECYKTAGDSVNAVHYFRQTFKVARDIGDERLIEAARAMLGFTLGEHYFTTAGNGEGFLHVVCNDIPAQLDWLAGGVL